jgi:hypothetical protein
MLKRFTLDEVKEMALDNNEHDVVIAHKFTGHNAKVGTRVDLQCQLCGHRVCLFLVSVDMVLKNGAFLFCLECSDTIESFGNQFRRMGRITDNKLVKEPE